MPKIQLREDQLVFAPHPTAHNFRDLTGQKYGRLAILGYGGHKPSGRQYQTFWYCRCDCGAITTVFTYSLVGNKTRSCGCLKVELARILNTTHGQTGTPLHITWKGIIRRCHSPKCDGFPNYGGRGIYVCERWRRSFEAFAEDMGERPSPNHSIGRIDNAGPYSNENCRWETYIEQANNKRSSRFIEALGKKQTLIQWSRELSVPRERIATRLNLGWCAECALMLPRGLPYVRGCKHR